MKRALYLCSALALAGFALWLCAGQADAYISIRIPVGNFGQALPTRWDLNNTAARPNIANRRVLYEIGDAGCADGPNFIGPISEFEAVQNSFSQWRNITESEIDFEFTGATTNAVSSANDNRNVIHWLGSNVSAGVFGVTITTFTTATGQITDVDMELNDRDFTWDTVGPGATAGHVGRAIIENVVTHEIGHFIGLDHPANSRSTMFFQSAPGLISSMSLQADDRAPIIADYASPDHADPRLGSVSGSVNNGMSPQFGVEISLLDLATGRNVVGSISEGTPGPFVLGSFEVQNVPPGNYAVLCWPTNRQALGSYYSSAFISFYPVIHGVAVGTAGVPTLARVGPGSAVNGISITLPGLPQSPFEPNGTSATAKDIASGQAAVATINPGSDEDWFKFTTAQPNQQVRVRVMADVLGSTLNPTLTMFGTNGSTVLVSPNFGDPAFMASANDLDSAAFDVSGPNFDAEIVRTMAVPGTYFFRVASRQGATNGAYVVVLEIEGTVTAVDANLSGIGASTLGTPAGGGGFTVSVTPRNMLGRDLNTGTFNVELIDATGAPVVMDTINGSPPFVFSVAALGTSQVVKYGARIDGNPIAETISVSHYGAVSLANSKVVALEKTISGNGYDIIGVRVDLRDGSNNPFRDPAASVLVSTTLGTLNNGTASGASGVAATYDPGLGMWKINLVAPTAAGVASITATVGGNVIPTGVNVTVLQRATGTGTTGGGGSGGGDDDEDDGGSCTARAVTLPVPIALAAGLLFVLRRHRRITA